MIFLFHLLSKGRLEPDILETGWFDCPRCESSQACAHTRLLRTKRLFGVIPLGAPTQESEAIVCRNCGENAPVENYTLNPSTQVFEMIHWDCPYCKHLNPNTTYKCKRCERSLI